MSSLTKPRLEIVEQPKSVSAVPTVFIGSEGKGGRWEGKGREVGGGREGGGKGKGGRWEGEGRKERERKRREGGRGEEKRIIY